MADYNIKEHRNNVHNYRKIMEYYCVYRLS